MQNCCISIALCIAMLMHSENRVYVYVISIVTVAGIRNSVGGGVFTVPICCPGNAAFVCEWGVGKRMRSGRRAVWLAGLTRRAFTQSNDTAFR